MKIILSRKGFDSSAGGYPSPILPGNGCKYILPLPIPETWPAFGNKTSMRYNNTTFYEKEYYDLLVPNQIQSFLKVNGLNITTYQDLLDAFLPKRCIKVRGKSTRQSLPWTCHLDPDLLYSIVPRNQTPPRVWRALFGQAGAAESHLSKIPGTAGHISNHGVGNGDLFLFFGWFKHVTIANNQLIYVNTPCPNGIHVIFGYMFIDYKIVFNRNRNTRMPQKVQAWMLDHPHFKAMHCSQANNSIYVATAATPVDPQIPGSGIFLYDDDLVLTETDPHLNASLHRSKWKYNFLPKGTVISYHNPNTSWCSTGNGTNLYFQSAMRGQEFLIDQPPTNLVTKILALIRMKPKLP